MDVELDHILISQLPLFDVDDNTVGLLELFPMVWSAAENLSSPDSQHRLVALEYLCKSGAVRLSPLIAYILYTRITDPDLEIRSKVVEVLGNVFTQDPEGRRLSDTVRHHLTTQLGRMRTREIYALLQVMVDHPEYMDYAIRLLNACPYAGTHLAEVASSRKAPLEVRRSAIRLLGEVGYLDAIPTLDRILIRLESRVSGQQAMPFAPPAGIDDTPLLPDIKNALAQLRSA
jgi:HEAT repeat protein